MTADKNYWKDAYKEYWEVASSKEKFVKELVARQTGLTVIEVGLGAGSTAYLPGSASDHNLDRGDADLYIPDKDCYIEVTGPNVPMPFSAPLWIRPDKLKNTYSKIKQGKGKLHVIFHVLMEKETRETRIRVILFNEKLISCLKDGTFKVIRPTIRGLKEKYVELPPEHEVIVSADGFFERLKEL